MDESEIIHIRMVQYTTPLTPVQVDLIILLHHFQNYASPIWTMQQQKIGSHFGIGQMKCEKMSVKEIHGHIRQRFKRAQILYLHIGKIRHQLLYLIVICVIHHDLCPGIVNFSSPVNQVPLQSIGQGKNNVKTPK